MHEADICSHNCTPPSLKAHLARIAAAGPTAGFVISRFRLSDNGHYLPKPQTLEIEAYTKRWGPSQEPGKLLWRVDGLGTPVKDWFSTHEMFFTEASWPIRNMDGTPVGTTDPLQVRRMEVNEELLYVSI